MGRKMGKKMERRRKNKKNSHAFYNKCFIKYQNLQFNTVITFTEQVIIVQTK